MATDINGVEIAILVIVALLFISFWAVVLFLKKDRDNVLACTKQVSKLASF